MPGRFRVYSTSADDGRRQTENGVSIRDVVTGGTIGSFALPEGKTLARQSGMLVTPDGLAPRGAHRDDHFALWRRGLDRTGVDPGAVVDAPTEGEGTIASRSRAGEHRSALSW